MIFLTFPRALDKIVGPIVIGVLIGIGYFLLIIPGLILTFMWMFAPCVQGDDPILASSKHESVLSHGKGQVAEIAGLIIVLAIINLLGTIPLGLGLLITLPVTHVALYTAYSQCKRTLGYNSYSPYKTKSQPWIRIVERSPFENHR